MKRTVMVVDDEQNMQTVMRMGKPEFSRTDLTSVRAGDAAQDVPISREHMDVRERSPATEARAGVYRNLSRRAREGRHQAETLEGELA